jgi:flagellar FliJ protein
MKRSKRLEIVEKLAQQREDQAAQALAQVRRQLEVEQQRLDELMAYRSEYQGYLDQQSAQGISIEQWRRTQGFIDQLGSLAERQQNAIDGWQKREQQVLAKWRELYQKRKNIAQFIGKVSMEEFVEADKKEQKMIDEIVTQRFHAK